MEAVVQLQTQVATEAYRWYEAVAALAEGEVDTLDPALATLHHYLTDLHQAAANAHLQGLAEICQYLTAYFTQLRTLETSQRCQLCTDIEPWPRRVINYLYSPTDITMCEQLLACLPPTTDALPQPRSLEALIQLLLQPPLDHPVEPAADQATTTVSASTTTTDKVQSVTKTPVKTEVKIVTNYISSRGENLPVPQLSDLSKQIVEQSDSLGQALNQILSHDEEDEAFFTGIEQYTNTVQQFWELAEKIGLKSFQTVCTFINDNFFEYSNLSNAERLERYESFGQWTQVAVDYLNQPAEGATALIEYLSRDTWLFPLVEPQAKTLLNQLIQEGTFFQLANSPQSVPPIASATAHPSDAAVLPTEEMSPSPTHDEAESSPAIHHEEIIDEVAAIEAETDEFALPMALDMPTEDLHLLSSMAEEVSLADLELPEPLENLAEEDISLPAELIAVTEIAEESPLPPPTLDSTEVTSLSELAKPPASLDSEPPLAAAEANLSNLAQLLSEEHPLLLQPDLADLAGDELPRTTEITELPELTTEPDQTILAPADLASDELPRTTEITELSELTAEPDQTVLAPAVSTNRDEEYSSTTLITPAVLDLLTAEITEAHNDLIAAVNKFVTAKDDSPTLVEAVEQYNDNVQSILETAQKVGLSAIQYICTFIHDNVFELSTQPHGIRQAAKTYIETWPRLVLTYLNEPLQGIPLLTTHLQHPAWPLALNDKQAQMLVARLTQEALGKKIALELEDSRCSVIEPELPLPAEATGITPTTTIAADREIIEPPSVLLETIAPTTSDEEVDAIPSTPEVVIPTIDAVEIVEPPLALLEAVVTDEEVIEPPAEILATTTTPIESVVLATHDDPIIQLIYEITPVLATTLDTLITAASDSEVFLNAIESYTDNVLTIWNSAETAGLEGIQAVCNFINDNVMALSAQEPTERQQCHEVLVHWPEWVIAYLQDPLTATPVLITHLRNPAWPLPLDEETVSQLQQFGKTDSQVTPPELTDTDLALPTTTESETIVALPQAEAIQPEVIPSLEPVTLAAPDVIELLIGQLTEIAELIEPILAQLMAAEAGSEALLTAVESYTDNVQIVWDAAEMAGLTGLQAIGNFINDNVVAISDQDPTNRSNSQSALLTWPTWVIAYLQNPLPAADELISHLQAAHWPLPLDDAAATQLQQQLIPSSPAAAIQQEPVPLPTPAAEASEAIVLAAPDIIAVLVSQITEIADLFNSLLDPLTATADGSETLLSAVESYTDNLQAIWDAAEMAKLTGLQEVCSFVNDNVITLSSQDQATRQAGRELLATWPALVIAYLQNPGTAIVPLINHLQHSNWSVPLDGETAAQLQQRLKKSSHSPPVLTTTPPQPTESTIPSSTSTVVPQIYLAAPEVLEVVSSQISDVAEGLSAALEVCVSMENDNPALFEAIESYTNQLQAICDAAEMAGLSGLQEVCTFVNDNLMAFSIQATQQKSATQTYFLQWPAKVLAYLQSPATAATDLVTFLQEPGWPTPLETEAATQLLNLLTQPAPSPPTDQEMVADLVTAPEVVSSSAEITPIEVADGADISLGSMEVLEILRTELESAKSDLAIALQQFTTLPPTDPHLSEVLENYTDQVQRLDAAAEIMGLEGLKAVCTLITDNVKALSTREVAVRTQAKNVLERWPDLILAYLQTPAQSVAALVNHFREPQWAQPLDDTAAQALLNQLLAGSTSEEEEDTEAAYSRQTVANPEDVLLTIPEEVNRELLDAYLQETPQHAADFSVSIQTITQNPDQAEISKAQRIAHTLKGSSNIIGIKGIANLAHHLEDTLEYLAKNQVVPPQELTDTMVEAADCMEIMVDALLGNDDPPPQAQQVLQTVLDWANRIDKGKLDAPPKPTRSVTTDAEEVAAPAQAQPAKKEEAQTAKPTSGSAEVAASTPEQLLRVPTKTVDELMRLVGELSISVGQIQEKLKHVIQSTRTLTEQDLILQKKTFELENLVDVRGITGIESRYHRLNEEDEDFDPLEFEEYNELHSVAHSFIESIADNRELAMSIRDDLALLETMFIHQERLNKEFQSSIMTTRMVPVNTIISKLQRNIRQTCRMTGKKADLEVSGTDILIDSDVLNNLADPLQHILRNAIDHGIENADERTILGKPEAGYIQLSFYREGNNIVVKCQDDGQGLNYTNIRFTAIQRGLITENQELTEAELARLILMSGFSTKSGVTQVSGRGVGMDVVHTNIRQMKGTLDLVSETGKGTIILIKLPMTLVTVHVLLVRIGNRVFGITSNNLDQALAPSSGEFQLIGEEMTFKMGKNIYALKSLANLLNLPGDHEGFDNCESRPVILAREETGITAVLVDELIDTHDLVMKSMGKYVKNIHGVAGATILGDGSLVPLLDLPELLRSPLQTKMSSYLAQQAPNEETTLGAPAVPRIMVVDDSLSVRKSLSILLEDAGFETLLAKDGLEAIEVMNQQRPHVMLVDMEMPRMNGLELTAHVRANQATQKLPIFMITSRTTEKHREQAKLAGVNAYLTKPYQDAELLDLIDKALSGTF
jgi:chemosensory pili system protein ChpA (sensor histidine kinase/response regulator)